MANHVDTRQLNRLLREVRRKRRSWPGASGVDIETVATHPRHQPNDRTGRRAKTRSGGTSLSAAAFQRLWDRRVELKRNPGKRFEPRTAFENYEIIKAQMEKNRDPFFLFSKERGVFVEVLERAAAAYFKSHKTAVSKIIGGWETISKAAPGYFQDHIRQRRSDGGSMAPLSPTYKKWKRKSLGHVKILIASGQLINSIRGKVRRK